MGSRALRSWLLAPPRDRGPALQRQSAIAVLRNGPWQKLRDALKGSSDVERISARIALRQVRPRELVGLRHTLQKSEQLALALQGLEASLTDISQALAVPPGCAELLQAALQDEPAALVRDGGVIAAGLDAELDELRAIQTNCDSFLLDLEQREKARTGIATLRVQYNKVHGFYIEVSQGQASKVPDDYRRRQTLKNAERSSRPSSRRLRTRP
jgi:DNA mismatch repair protein MutS